ncbi:MAG TPA: flagellar biosynthesis anti-sigma factor FlgM [Stellaceae bacterium]|nr:flagellar biosynthesis anti-sigma factor FlgM [Stellaceae bacterium]
MPDPILGVSPTQPPDVGASGTAAEPGGPTPHSAPNAVDSADVARAESLLATIAAAAEGVSVIDPSRVAELQRAILSGTYTVDPQQIAGKLVQIEQFLAAGGQ